MVIFHNPAAIPGVVVQASCDMMCHRSRNIPHCFCPLTLYANVNAVLECFMEFSPKLACKSQFASILSVLTRSRNQKPHIKWN